MTRSSHGWNIPLEEKFIFRGSQLVLERLESENFKHTVIEHVQNEAMKRELYQQLGVD